MKNSKGFTLVELLAVVVILMIVLAIAIPTVASIIKSSTKGAFRSDAKMVLQAIEYKKLNNASFNPQEITKENMMETLGLSSNNYKQVNISVANKATEIVIIGQNKWNGLTAYGTIKNMTVVDSKDYGAFLPVITILGDNPVNIGQNEIYIDAGATAVNDKGEYIPITSTVIRNASNVVVDNVDTASLGTYTIIYTVTDENNHTATSVRRVNVVDKVPPVITLLGNNPETMSLWGTYVDAGATATDNVDGDITSSIITTGNIFPNLAGTYTITYEVSDSFGNVAAPVTRTIEVLPDTTIFNYTGSTKTYTAPITGTYQIELWGAQGGNSGGKGGYTTGEVALTKGNTVYVYVGGTTSNYVAGWNGGGTGSTSAQNGYGGGGSTDVRIGGTTDKDRIMVAGGGGGNSCSNTYLGGTAGGLVGTNGSGAPVFYGTGGTQTVGGQTGTSGANLFVGSPGAFYAGGVASWCGGGGGGGYYGGGGAAYSNGSGTPWGGGGGGSSFISGYEGCNAINTSGTNTNQPNHYSGYVFTNSQMIAGNASMPIPAGGTETGHTGNGYARIKSIGYANERPHITIIGSNPMVFYQGLSYVDDGATAIDDKDGNLTNKIISQGNVNPSIPGTYEVIYTVKDSDGITMTAKRTVKVVATQTNFAYTGSSQSFVPAMAGHFKVELWGAQGGNSGGKGSYAVGEISLSPSDVVYVYVGGTTSNYVAGWNGGGTGSTSAQNGYGGGGSTDIRIGGTTNKDRIMVAGGGGGNSCYNTYLGGAAGSLVGTNGAGAAVFYGTGGTQTAGGQTGTSGTNLVVGSPGAFYAGGSASWCGGGGGGGYYGGGGAAYSNSSGTPWGAGGGGSSFVSGYTGCNAIDSNGNPTGQPNHYLGHVFTNGQIIAGNVSMPIPVGGTETGHTGNGYARITFISR